MRQLSLSDDLYDAVARSAREAGFTNVDEYASELLDAAVEPTPNLDHLFTPERMAIINRAVAQADNGQVCTLDELESYLADVTQQWLRENPDRASS